LCAAQDVDQFPQGLGSLSDSDGKKLLQVISMAVLALLAGRWPQLAKVERRGCEVDYSASHLVQEWPGECLDVVGHLIEWTDLASKRRRQRFVGVVLC
jgi:hypothetical protein